jgi:hypothetical protein
MRERLGRYILLAEIGAFVLVAWMAVGQISSGTVRLDEGARYQGPPQTLGRLLECLWTYDPNTTIDTTIAADATTCPVMRNPPTPTCPRLRR